MNPENKKDLPKLTIIIPCRNEEKFIGRCLDSLMLQNYPKNKMEILVVDGASEDKTREIVKSYSQKYPFIKLLENPKKVTSFALNIGLKKMRGDIMMHTGAHSTYEPNYIAKSVKYLREYNADNVGGVLLTKPATNTLAAKSIALVLSNRFGTGNSYFRTGSEKPRFVDTVFGGCYKREVFEKIGPYNENLTRSQDMEFNLRLKKAGGKILLAPDIVSYYHPKSTLAEFFKHNIADGIWAIYPLKFGAPLFKLRHLIPLLFVGGLLTSAVISIFFKPFIFVFSGILALYLIVSLFFSFSIATKEKNLALIPFLVLAFASRHFGYGIGSFAGLIKLLIPSSKREF